MGVRGSKHGREKLHVYSQGGSTQHNHGSVESSCSWLSFMVEKGRGMQEEKRTKSTEINLIRIMIVITTLIIRIAIIIMKIIICKVTTMIVLIIIILIMIRTS